MNWKTGLLESNLPLEHQIMDILRDKGFKVDSDYKYARNDAGVIRDYAVDVYANAYTPFTRTNEITSKVELVVECEHRHPDIKWLFIPGVDSHRRDNCDASAIRIVDQFSSCLISRDRSIEFDQSIPVCQKGVEINIRTGDAVKPKLDKRFKKLQHVLPRLYTENVLLFLTADPDFNLPFIFCPILVTSTSLHMLKQGVTADHIERAEVLEEVAGKVPYMMMYFDYGPDFEHQCKSECKRLTVLQRTDKAMHIEQKRARYFNRRDRLPFTIMESLMTGDRHYLRDLFTRFIVCSEPYFNELVEKIKAVSLSAAESREEIGT